MRFKEGDKVEFIYRNKKSVGEINGVYPEKQAVEVIVNGCLNVSFPDKAIAKVEEQERLVVPQFIADWYEQHRDKLEHSIWQYIYCWDVQKRKSDFYNFMKNDNLKPVETLIKMKDGYEVEKEPVWVVENENGYRLRSITMNPGNSLNWSFDSKNKNYIEFEEFETAKKAAYLVTGNVTEI
ncbi:DUF1642 domain-containing protein [Listeria monocytogenes]|nr:DUF1642 domain-containing protein [Listeria monocytogenes]